MNRSEAGKTARELIGQCICLDQRNVWVFRPMQNRNKRNILITKDNAIVKRSGVFFEDEALEQLTDAVTGEIVDYDDVLGAPFFADDPTLFEDRWTTEHMTTEQKVGVLLSELREQFARLNLSAACIIMLDDFLEEPDESAIKRLVVLCNYLSRQEEKLDTEDFVYLHHELFSI